MRGPQTEAYYSEADELFYGGAAGGGKSDLLLGLTVTAHKKSIIFRRELTQLSGPSGLIERSRDIIGEQGRYNGIEHAWRDVKDGRAFEFGAVQYDKDKRKYQGRPHDLIAFDELPEFTESIYRFLIGWLRTTDPEQRCRVVATGNPPSHADGEWVIRYWAPWLDDHHPSPAEPGELRWFATIDGKDCEVDGPKEFEHVGQTITPKSRTFIPARLSDNPYLERTGYAQVLNNLPEPLRSQLLYGDFTIGLDDDPWQVIPTAWVRAAMARGKEREKPDTPLTAIGVDIARGGDDQTALSKRHDNWFAPLEKHAGRTTPDGPTAAAVVIASIGSDLQALINVDVIGVGSSAYDSLVYQEIEIPAEYSQWNAPLEIGLPRQQKAETKAGHLNVIGVNFSEGTKARDRSGMLAFRNVRAAAWWGMREALDPVKGDDIALPDDPELLADLVTPKWKISASGIQIESKPEIKKRIGRSPDCGDAVVLANYGSYGAWEMFLSRDDSE